MRWLSLVVLVGCGGSPPPAPAKTADPPPPVDAPPPIDAAVDAAVAVAPIDAPPPALTFDPKRPAVKGAVSKLAIGNTATIGGVAVAFVGQNHKHPAGPGRALGMWTFKVAGAELELRSNEDGFEAEVDAHGALLVFRHVDYGIFEIVAAGRTPKPLDEDACVALVDKQAAAQSLPDNVDGYRSEHGFTIAQSKRWIAHCGRYTRRVWFGKKATDD